MQLEFSQQIFEKYSNIEFNENPSSGSWLFHADGRVDIRKDSHYEADSRFSQFCERF
jgi:hypothetical protein